MKIKNVGLGICGVMLAGLLLGCQQPEKKPPKPPEPVPSTERVINPWSSSSSPNAPYQSLGQPAGVINPWVRPPTTVSPEELPLPEEFAGIPRAAALSTLRDTAPPSSQ